MTKSFLAVLSCLLVMSALPLGAGASPGSERKGPSASRTIEIRYEEGAIPFLSCGDCPGARALPGERFISVEVIDDVSPRGNVDVVWTSKNEKDPGYFNVCGKTEAPQRIRPLADLTFYAWKIPDTTCSTGFSTSGTIKVTFSRRP